MSEADVRAVFREHDRCWNALEIEGLGRLWDADDARASYLGDEYRSPVVGAEELRRHWGRTGSRLRGAKVASEPKLIDLVADDIAIAIVDMRWSFAGVEGGQWRTGRSWVTAVMRRTVAGWRFVSYMERLSETGDLGR